METTLINEDNISEIFDKHDGSNVSPAPNEQYVGDKTIDGLIFFKSLLNDEYLKKNLQLSAEHDQINICAGLHMLKDSFNEQDVATLSYFGFSYDDDGDFFYKFI